MERVTDERGWHLSAASSVVASTLAVWFLVGQLAEEGGTDYIFRIPRLNRTIEIVLGFIAVATAITSAAVAGRRRDLLIEAGWWRVYGRLLLIGLVVASGLRIVTAASGGANIGGGMILYLYPIPLLYFVEHALREARALRGAGYPDPCSFWSLDWLALGSLLIATALIATD